jgi:hypothetical protein
MGNDRDEILETILRASAPGGDEFALLTFRDGSYGIGRNGTPIPEMRWPDGQLKQCVETLVRLAGLDGDERAS